jgi:hypothetical protein
MTHAIQQPVSRDVATGDTGEITGCSVAYSDRQNRGIDTALLDLRGVPAHPEANDSRDRDFDPRHGYVRRSVGRLPGRPANRSIWGVSMP